MNKAMVTVLMIAAGVATAADDTVRLGVLSSGAVLKLGGYVVQNAALGDQRPATLTHEPADLVAPRYAVLPIAGPEGAVFHVVVDAPDGNAARLFVDRNGNGDLTDDPVVGWLGEESGGGRKYSGSAFVEIGEAESPFPAGVGVYWFDDPQRPELRDALRYYRDYAREGELTISGKAYRVMLGDNLASGDFRAEGAARGLAVPKLMIDINANAEFDARGEEFPVNQPFNIGGTTYEIAELTRSGDSFRLVKSAQSVPEIPLPPDHHVGKTITPFDTATVDGRTVKFPSDYKGRVVMLDFWATWCGPCMAEVPGLVRVYDQYHEKRFDVLGISLDGPAQMEMMKQVIADNDMKWPHVLDGLKPGETLVDLYAVDGIPELYLVDGDTGEILARDEVLRGEHLAGTIERALAKKRGK